MATEDEINPAIATELGNLFPPECVGFVASSTPVSYKLFPAEAECTTGMAERRLKEFKLGRYCARISQLLLGLRARPVTKGVSREPHWPPGVIGSISHTGDFAVAVVAAAATLESVGLDMESAEPLTADIIAMTCLPQENPNQDGALGKLLFSIKESIYKCIFPLVGEYVDFLEMEVRLSEDGQSYYAISHTDKCPAALIQHLEGRYARLPDLVLSSAWISKRDD